MSKGTTNTNDNDVGDRGSENALVLIFTVLMINHTLVMMI
jgi:hypothetical protein